MSSEALQRAHFLSPKANMWPSSTQWPNYRVNGVARPSSTQWQRPHHTGVTPSPQTNGASTPLASDTPYHFNRPSLATPSSVARYPLLPLSSNVGTPLLSAPFVAALPPKCRQRAFGPFGVSALGTYCVDCRKKVGASRTQLTRHFKCHEERYGSLDLVMFADSVAKKSVKILPLEETVVARAQGFACRCGVAFLQKGNLVGHATSKKNSCILPEELRRSEVVETVCGRLVAEWLLVDRMAELNAPKLQLALPDVDQTVSFLRPLLRLHETAEDYLSIFRPLASEGDVATVVGERLLRWDEPIVDDRFDELMSIAEVWLADLRGQIDLIPPNYRAKLLVFDGQDIGEVRQNFTFQLRHKEASLFLELSKLLRFCWRDSRYHDLFMVLDFSTVPRVLRRLFLEKVDTFTRFPTIVLYCISRFFRTRKGQLEMLVAGDSSSIMSTVTHLLRAGICSYCYLSGAESDRVTAELVQEANQSRALNILSSFVRRLREIQAAKPRVGLQTTTADGDIAIDGFEFPRNLWSKEIPAVEARLEDLFSRIFVGDDWRSFLTEPLEIDKDFRFRTASISDEDLVLAGDFDASAFCRVPAYLGLSMHGHGAGSMRFQELLSMKTSFLLFVFGTCRYSSRPLKSFRTMSSKKPPVDRLLPWTISRYWLLYHRVRILRGFNTEKAIELSDTYNIRHAVASLYSLPRLPTMLQVRHKVASQSNVLFPEGTLKRLRWRHIPRDELESWDPKRESYRLGASSGWARHPQHPAPCCQTVDCLAPVSIPPPR